tara:strand:+ start:519 stop:1136 length:618 start_codon:yes stop_codon:yes gene_type:complete
MPDFKMGNPAQTVLSQSGTARPTWGAGVPKGSVIEEFMSPCDGSSITVQSGTYTVETVSAIQQLTTSYVDVTGSSIDYTPPTGTQTVVYTFSFQFTFTDSYNIGHFKLFLDNDSGTATEVTNFRTTIAANNVLEGRYTVVWGFNIGGSTTTATGRVATWTSARTIKFQAREHTSSFESALHTSGDWDGGGTDQFSQPVIGIKALA